MNSELRENAKTLSGSVLEHALYDVNLDILMVQYFKIIECKYMTIYIDWNEYYIFASHISKKS